MADLKAMDNMAEQVIEMAASVQVWDVSARCGVQKCPSPILY